MLRNLLDEVRRHLGVRIGVVLMLAAIAGFVGELVCQYLLVGQMRSLYSLAAHGVAIGVAAVALVWLRRFSQALEGVANTLEEGYTRLTELPNGCKTSGSELDRLQALAAAYREIAHGQQVSGQIEPGRCPPGLSGGAPVLLAQPGDASESPTLRSWSKDALQLGKGGKRIHLGALESLADVALTSRNVAFELNALLGGAASLLASQADAKGIELVLDVDPGLQDNLIGNPICLTQMLHHLAADAISAGRGGELVLQVREQSHAGDQVELQFGILRQCVGRVATPQGSPYTSTPAGPEMKRNRPLGAGLGMAICQKLADMLGGELWGTPSSGSGIGFHFTARFRSRIGTSKLASNLASLKAFSGRRVMVIDDSASARQVVGALLSRLGFVPELFESGQLALARLLSVGSANYLFCCIDQKMPGMDGPLVAQRLRAYYGSACPPLLLMTVPTPSGELQRLGKGFAAVLSKPCTPEKLFHFLASILPVRPDERRSDRQWNDPSQWSGFEGKRVLLVEESGLRQELIGDLLEQAKLKVRLAANGVEALEAILEERPDCILVAHEMALEATARLRALGYGLPIIVLGPKAPADGREACQADGVNDYLSEPTCASALLSMLAKWTEPGARERSPAGPLSSAEQIPSPGSVDTLPPLPAGLDVESGLRRLRGKTNLFLQALRMFRDSRGQQFQFEFRAAVVAEDWQTSERFAHSLKDTAATIGAHEVSAAAANLEAAIRAHQYKEVQPLLAEVTDKLRAIVDGLAHIR